MEYPPDFTAAQRRRLQALGVLPEQVEELREVALPATWEATHYRRPARNDVKAELEAVVIPAERLAHTLRTLLDNPNEDLREARAEALVQFGGRYQRWCIGRAKGCARAKAAQGHRDRRRAETKAVRTELHDNPNPLRRLVERLDVLAELARAGVPVTGSKTVHRLDTKPIKEIDRALLRGWHRVHPVRSGVASTRETMFPRRFQPSSKSKRGFRQIVAVCYEAAAPAGFDPTRSVDHYASEWRRTMKRLAARMYPEFAGNRG